MLGRTCRRTGRPPDGKWIAYAVREKGTSEIYVQPASLSGGKWGVSPGGGNMPRWRGDSRELFYVAGVRIMAVELTTDGSALTPGPPKPLFDVGIFANHADYFPYAVTRDGQRFLVARPVSRATDASSPIVVMLNWAEGFRK